MVGKLETANFAGTKDKGKNLSKRQCICYSQRESV